MNPQVQSALVSGVVALLVWLASSRANRRSQTADRALQERSVDSQGKAVDLSILKESLEDLKGRVEGMEDELTQEREARLLAMRRAEEAEARAAKAEARANSLEARVTQLEETLRAHDITVPPVP